jgi:hypothetical protein
MKEEWLMKMKKKRGVYLETLKIEKDHNPEVDNLDQTLTL